jgi:acetyltransferase-like isoleucine patch superfamily enzyme
MTLKSRVLFFFPSFMMASFAFLVAWSIRSQNVFIFLAAIAFLYLFPVLCLRLNKWWHGPYQELHRFGDAVYCSWWGSHQIQLIFIAFPILERVLRLIPGVYSSWLRLWGANIGRRVYWTPHVEILDRDLVEVGHEVIFGHLVKVASHVVTPRKGGLVLFVRPVVVKDQSFVGAGTVLGPGTQIQANSYIPAGSEYFNGKLVST